MAGAPLRTTLAAGLLAASVVPLGAAPAVADHDAPCLVTELPDSERLADTHAKDNAAADRMPVACVSLGARDGGSELALLLASSGVPMQTASHGAEAAERIAGLRERALVLVDTPSVSPRAGRRTR